MIEREIAEFGRRMGMPAFSLSLRGSPRSTWSASAAPSGACRKRQGRRELLVYLARAVPEYERESPTPRARALPLPATPIPCGCPGGMHKGNIVLLTRFPERQATAAGIERAVQFLSGVMDTVAKA